MKRLRNIIIFINIVLLMCYFTSNESTPDVESGEPGNQAIISIEMLIDNGIEDISIYKEALALMPSDVLSSFNSEGWILCIKTSLEDNVAGYTDYANKRIVLNDSLKGQKKINLIHEFGHFVDYINDFPSGKEPFISLYNANLDYIEYEYVNITDMISSVELGYATSDERELFASVFKEYMLNKNYLDKNYPELYEFIKEILK